MVTLLAGGVSRSLWKSTIEVANGRQALERLPGTCAWVHGLRGWCLALDLLGVTSQEAESVSN